MRYAAVRVLGRCWRDALRTSRSNRLSATRRSRRSTTAIAPSERPRWRRWRDALRARSTALTDLFTYYASGEPAEAALDALAHIAHGTSVLCHHAGAGKSTVHRRIAMEVAARADDASQLNAIQTAVDKERDAGVILAAAFALVRLGNASITRLADSLSRPRLREQAKRYLIEVAPGRTSAFTRQLLDSDVQIRRRRRRRARPRRRRPRSRRWNRDARSRYHWSRARRSGPSRGFVKATAEALRSQRRRFLSVLCALRLLPSRFLRPSTLESAPAICSARCWFTTVAVCARAGWSSKWRRTSANPILPVTRLRA